MRTSYSSQNIHGVWIALVTPWDSNLSIPRRKALACLVQRLFSADVNGLFVLGTTGEGFLFTAEERETFTEVLFDEVGDKLPVIVHVGHDNFKVAMKLAKHAQKTGAVGVAVAPPARYRLDQGELERYFVGIAETVSDLPVLLYDIPSASCNTLGAQFLLQVHEKAPNIVGAKVSRAEWSAWEDYLEITDRFSILVGHDPLCLPLLIMGASGIVSGPANVFPEMYVELYKSIKINEDIKSAVIYQKIINKLCRALNYGQPLAFIKEALEELLGIELGEVQPPLRTLRADERARLRSTLEELVAIFHETRR